MRVLDPVEILLDDTLKISMGKNKKKLSSPSRSNSRKTSASTPVKTDPNEENAEEGAELVPSVDCRHLKNSLNSAQVRKKLKNCRIFHCEDCEKGSKKGSGKTENAGGDDNGYGEIFCCLACGHLGCGRFTEEKHAVKHFEQPRSGGPHALVLNLRTFGLWCYSCDTDLPINISPQCKDIVDLIGKQQKAAVTNSSHVVESDGQKPAASANTESTKATSQVKTRAGARSATMPSEIKGLTNLGNTCFFNAVMQNMAQTHLLDTVLNDAQSFLKGAVISLHPKQNAEEEADSSLVPLRVTIDEDPGLLTAQFRKILTDFRVEKSSIINPSALFTQVCKKAPRFRGYQQQDSHELLRHMLDAMRTDELRRLRATVTRHFGLEPETLDKAKVNSLDPELKRKIIAYGDVVQQTFVEQIFGGQLLQFVQCLSCNNISKRYEAFLDLSLPIVEAKDSKKQLTVLKKDDDDDLKALQRNEKNWNMSKHQQKKAKKEKRKTAKTSSAKRRNSANEGDQAQNDDQTTNNAAEPTANGNESAQLVDDLTSKLKLIDDETSENSLEADDTVISTQNGDAEMKSINSDNDEEDRNDEETATKSDDEKVQENGDESCMEPMNTTEPDSGGSSLGHYLRQFTAIELLNGKNKFGCSNCAKIGSNVRAQGSEKDTMANGDGSGTVAPQKRNRKDSLPVVYSDAEKRYLIYSPPAVLTLHLKRFQQVGACMRKISKHVEFPLILDISPYCCKYGKRYNSAHKQVLYSLYGIVCHSGGMSGGHYIAYVKVRPRNEKLSTAFLQPMMNGDVELKNGDIKSGNNRSASAHMENGVGSDNGVLRDIGPPQGKWYYVSDTSVSEVPESRVLTAEAFLLFYERIF